MSYDRYTYDVSARASRVETVPGALAAKTVDFSTDGGGAAATGVLTSNNTNVSDEDTVTIGSTVYSFETALTEVKASGTITSNNTNVSDGDVITLGSTTYRFKTIMLAINDVQIGASADASLQSLIYAINGAGTAGTDYFTGTVANTSASAGTLSAHAFTVTALTVGTAGNSIVLTKTATTITVSGSGTLSGGVNSVANEVVVSAVNADGSLTNLAAAINGSAGAGTTYSSATVANTNVTSSAVASHALTMTAITPGVDANAVATTTTATTLSWGNTTLTGGTDNISLFTVTGDVLYAIIGICKTSCTGANATLEVGFTGALNAAIPSFTATNLTANKIVDSTGVISAGTAPATTPVRAAAGQTFVLTEGVAEVTAGVIDFYCIYQPLSAGAKVTAN